MGCVRFRLSAHGCERRYIASMVTLLVSLGHAQVCVNHRLFLIAVTCFFLRLGCEAVLGEIWLCFNHDNIGCVLCIREYRFLSYGPRREFSRWSHTAFSEPRFVPLHAFVCPVFYREGSDVTTVLVPNYLRFDAKS